MRILYVTKWPPSSSGVALYARTFESVLSGLGTVERALVPAEPSASQSLAASLRAFVVGFGTGRRYHLVHVELSGRALVEFYFALGVVLRPSRFRPALALTCHDVPSLVGETGLFRGFDRRGMRRAARFITRYAGRPAERLLVRRADVVITLTRAGARRVQGDYDRHVVALPHVVDNPPPMRKQPVVLVPGYVGDAAGVAAVIHQVAAAPGTPAGKWEVLIGSCSGAVRAAAVAAIAETGVAASFTGQVDEDTLLAAFARAAVVVRPRHGADSANGLAASGPLSWAGARGCVSVTDDDRAGALELADDNLVVRRSEIEEPLARVLACWDDTVSQGDDVKQRMQATAGVPAVARAYLEALSVADTWAFVTESAN